jgi:N-methylhydantoinase B
MAQPVETVPGDTANGLEALDPVTFTVLLSTMDAICVEMTLSLERSAYSPVISVARDFSCSLYDVRCRQISMSESLPIHTNSQHLVLQTLQEQFEGDIHDGDVFLCNDPYSGNTHIGDLMAIAPVFHSGEQRFWSVVKAHHQDTGAPLPTSLNQTATDVFQEGLKIPPLRICDRGVDRVDIVRLYLANVRYPEMEIGDLRAQIGAARKGRQRLVELIDRYGREETVRYAEEMIRYADRRTADELRQFPAGEYRGEAWVDSDGQGDRSDIPIRVTVTIEDGDVEMDFEGSAPAVHGAVNSSYGALLSGASIPILQAIDPDIPHNQGCLDHIRVRSPKGSICNAEWPSATPLATGHPNDAIKAAVMKALAQAIPERVTAGWGTSHGMPQLAGIDARGSGRPWGVFLFNGVGAGPALRGYDGWPLLCSPGASGATKVLSIEVMELLYPFRVDEYELEPNSAGAGTWNGGYAVRFTLAPDEPIEANTWGDQMANPSHGVFGGRPGNGGGHYVVHADGSRTFYSGMARFPIGPGERYVIVGGSGGGYGDPLERDPAAVAADVRLELISADRARDLYGVVLAPGSLEPDLPQTEKLRARLASTSSGDVIDPAHPCASRWLEQQMGPRDRFVRDPRTI